MAWMTRLATAADYPNVARLFPELRVPDPTPTVEQFTTNMLPRVLLLCDGEAVLGYTFWLVLGATAHVVHVVVDPAARGRGAGTALMEATRAAALATGCQRWSLNVKVDNTPALRLYARCGLARAHDAWTMRMTWAAVDTLPAAAAAPAAFVLGDPDEQPVAARFGLEHERFAVWRRRGAILVALREADDLVGFAAFDPAFPGMHPFRVTRPALARALFDACRAHGGAGGRDFVHLVVEGDAALADALVASGAELQFALAHLRGPLATP
jgi:GNAT superfamily N-acetyltransferase